MVSKTPIGPANSAPHVTGCCSVLSVRPADQLLAPGITLSVSISPSVTATS
jgi:hypothetical protein